MAIPQKLKEAFANDPEILAILNEKEQAQMLESLSNKIGEGQKKEGGADFFSKLAETMMGAPGKTPVRGEDYLTEEEMKALKEEILKEATPEKFKDYFTDDELMYIMGEIKEGLREEVTPRKGEHYFDGENGKDADEVNVDEIVEAVMAKMPHDEKNELPPEEVKQRFADLEAKIPAVDAIVAQIKKGKLLELRDIKGARLDSPKMNMNDQRWHGGGASTSAVNIWTAPQRSSNTDLGVLTVDREIDFSTDTNFTLTMGANISLTTANIGYGQAGIITILGDSVTPYNLTLLSTEWKSYFGPDYTTTIDAGSINEIVYFTKGTYISFNPIIGIS